MNAKGILYNRKGLAEKETESVETKRLRTRPRAGEVSFPGKGEGGLCVSAFADWRSAWPSFLYPGSKRKMRRCSS